VKINDFEDSDVNGLSIHPLSPRRKMSSALSIPLANSNCSSATCEYFLRMNTIKDQLTNFSISASPRRSPKVRT